MVGRAPAARPPFRLDAAREEAKIRERFPIYMALPAAKIKTSQPPDQVASAIVRALEARTSGTK